MQLKTSLIAYKQHYNKFKTRVKSYIYKRLNRTSSFGFRTVLFKRCHIINSTIGKYTYFAGKADIHNATIGSFCSIADGVKIGVGAHPIHFMSTHPVFYSEKTIFPYNFLSHQALSNIKNIEESRHIKIGHDVWIGTNAIVLDGITIGNGAVIGAGAVVTKDVKDYAIVGGVPAAVIKYRNSPGKINGTTNWWELELEQLVSFLEALYERDSHAFDL
jgi:chloramphenicol O-acetyltransferase type B